MVKTDFVSGIGIPFSSSSVTTVGWIVWFKTGIVFSLIIQPSKV